MGEPNWKNRTLFHGDNLDFLRAMNSESVDLIATDPPFNKGRDFHATPDSLAKGARFQDRWSWEKDVHQEWVDQIEDDHPALMEAIESAKNAHSDGMGAFMCFMAVRLLAMRRVLRETGSIYLHCDPTASHYLKAVMDAVFGWKNFRNEIVWRRTATVKGNFGQNSKFFGPATDTVLFYSKTNKLYFRQPFTPYSREYLEKSYRHREPETGRRYRLVSMIGPGGAAKGNPSYEVMGVTRHWRYSKARMEELIDKGLVVQSKPGSVPNRKYYLDEGQGVPVQSLWDDIPNLQASSKERFGYPTQKPLALYERIIEASSNEGDIVLDPFCGCATTLVAAERLGRRWTGIDIWDKAHEAVIRRLSKEGLAMPDGKIGEALPLYGEIHYIKEPPERTDAGETATVALETINRKQLAAWQKLSHKQMVEILKEAQADSDNPKLVVCAGCGRKLESEFMELDHIIPKSEPRSTNDLSNRILLCRPCNGRKSNRLTMSGLWKENKSRNVGWMVDEKLAENAGRKASNAYHKIERQDG